MPRPARRAGGVTTLTVGLVVLLAACGDDRPTDAEWARTWDEARRGVPSADDLLSSGRCDELVGKLRTTKDRLEPAPTEALDAAVGAWIDQAERIAFDCPDDAAELTERYDELEVLAAEVDAGLAAAP